MPLALKVLIGWETDVVRRCSHRLSGTTKTDGFRLGDRCQGYHAYGLDEVSF